MIIKRTMNKRKVAVIGTAGLPASYGGFETLAEHLVEELADKFDFTVYCSGRVYDKSRRLSTYKGARLVFLPLSANGMQSIIYDCISILHAIFYADVLLVLGVPGAILFPFVKLFTNKRIITSIDGVEWKRSKWSKVARWYLWACEWLAVRFSSASIADNEGIQDYTAIRYRGLSTIIEYGADHVAAVKITNAHSVKYPFLLHGYAIKVCRIEPENNVHIVLDAFAQLPTQHLVIVGNWENSKYGRELRRKYATHSNITLLDPIYNQLEIDMLRSNAALYVHGHSAGGTNPSLVEAMYLGLPVMAYDVLYNRATTEDRAWYFGSAQELVGRIRTADAVDLATQGRQMRQLASRRYTWKVVAGKYCTLINAALGNRVSTSLRPALSRSLDSDVFADFEMLHLQAPAFFYEKRN